MLVSAAQRSEPGYIPGGSDGKKSACKAGVTGS